MTNPMGTPIREDHPFYREFEEIHRWKHRLDGADPVLAFAWTFWCAMWASIGWNYKNVRTRKAL